jgi:hypothetical protein
MVSSSDSIKYIGAEIDDLGIKKGDLLTDVIDKLANGYLSVKKELEESSKKEIIVSDKDIKINGIDTNVTGKYSGTLEVAIASGTGNSISFDLNDFAESILDNIVRVETNVYNSEGVIFSSDKTIFGQNILLDKYPLYGASQVVVWEEETNVTYRADFQIDNSAKTMSFDFEVERKNNQPKTQSELNQILVKNSATKKQQPIEFDGLKFASWQQCCSYLLGRCNSLQKQIDTPQNNISKSAANCGETIKTSDCQNC